MTRFCICFCVVLVTTVVPLRAANRPHAGADGQTIKVWTNDDLEKLHDVSPISVVGRSTKTITTPEPPPQGYEVIQDPQWYAQQAASMRDEREYRLAQLREYRQALEDARSLRETTGGIDLVGEDFAITPQAGIEILQQRVTEEEARLNDLEDLARRNDIEPGVLRGQ